MLSFQVNTTNPDVELWFADFSDGTIRKRQVAPPNSLSSSGEVHFSAVTWADENNFAVQWFNRFQTKTVLVICNTEGIDDCVDIFANEERDGWIDYKYKVSNQIFGGLTNKNKQL
jgi:hypothetical protein